MGIVFWICTISVVCIITGVTFYKPYLGIAFVIVSIPFEGSKIFDGISIYPLETVLAILVFICIFKLIVGAENYFRNTKLIYYYLPFMLCILLSALKSMEFSLTVKEIVRWVELIVIYFLTINLITDHKKVRVILYSMILTTAIVSVWGIINYLGGVVTIDGRQGTFSFFDHPNALAGYVNLIIPILFGMLMTCTLLWERITLGVFIMLTIATWFLTFSKSGWLSLIITMILIFFLTRTKKKVTFLLVLLLMSFAIVFFSSNIKSYFINRVLSVRSIETRIGVYPTGFNMVKDDLFFGIGIGNYPLIIKNFPVGAEFKQTNLHSLYLQVFVEAGLMGLCAFTFWLTGIIKYLMSALKSLEKSRDYDLFVGLMGGVIVYLFSNLANVLTVHGIHLQWGIILGLAVVLTQFRESEG
ncbi:MAG: O-antigen ligase family protein [Candidatus Scalindua sp.]